MSDATWRMMPTARCMRSHTKLRAHTHPRPPPAAQHKACQNLQSTQMPPRPAHLRQRAARLVDLLQRFHILWRRFYKRRHRLRAAGHDVEVAENTGFIEPLGRVAKTRSKIIVEGLARCAARLSPAGMMKFALRCLRLCGERGGRHQVVVVCNGMRSSACVPERGCMSGSSGRKTSRSAAHMQACLV